MAKHLKYINKSVKRKRKKFTIEDVFEKKRYRNIIALIVTYSDPSRNTKIKFNHLKYALVKDFKSKTLTEEGNYTAFFNVNFSQPFFDHVKSDYKNGSLNKQSYNSIIKNVLKKNKLQELKDFNWLTDETKFPCEQSLRDALTRLKNLKLIEQKPDSSGYDYYITTHKTLQYYIRWFLHYTIDELIPDEYNQALLILQGMTFELYTKILSQQKKK